MHSPAPPFQSEQVAQVFAAFPTDARDGLLRLRRLIFETAAETPGVGRIEETLKWGQPAYLTPETKSGSSLRLGIPKSGGFAIYVHCQTSIISEFRGLFPEDFTYEGNRAVHFQRAEDIRPAQLGLLIARALTYHLRAKAKAG